MQTTNAFVSLSIFHIIKSNLGNTFMILSYVIIDPPQHWLDSGYHLKWTPVNYFLLIISIINIHLVTHFISLVGTVTVRYLCQVLTGADDTNENGIVDTLTLLIIKLLLILKYILIIFISSKNSFVTFECKHRSSSISNWWLYLCWSISGRQWYNEDFSM